MFMELIISAIIGFVLATAFFLLIRFKRSKGENRPGSVSVYATIEKLRSVGELVVFKVITKEIITASDHWFGETGKKYFRWLASDKKVAMIFEFHIDFKYNLQSPDFGVDSFGDKSYRLKLPKCVYESHIKNISFYDEQDAKLLPWLLPQLISRAISDGFSEETKNRLIAEAKTQATKMAEELVLKMQPEVRKSAIRTLEVLARGFGAERVQVEFMEAGPIQEKVDYMPEEAMAVK